MQVQTHQKFHEASSSWIAAGAPTQFVMCIGSTSNVKLLLPAMAVVNDIPHFLGWWWFIWIIWKVG
jgi:hypothetical protein